MNGAKLVLLTSNIRLTSTRTPLFIIIANVIDFLGQLIASESFRQVSITEKTSFFALKPLFLGPMRKNKQFLNMNNYSTTHA